MRKIVLGILGMSAVLVSSQACQEKYGNDCIKAADCPPEGDGDQGGSSSGGTNGDGDGDGGTGGTTPVACGGSECAGETPICDEEAEQCVQCIETEHCDEGVCDTDSNECVECLENAQCTTADASLCDGGECTVCSENADCSHIDGLNVCDEGSCVECLEASDCGGNVCNRSTHTCTELTAGTEFACEACVHDAQCAPGHVCVEMSYDDPAEGIVGSFCLWEKDAGPPLPGPNGACGLNSRPYAQEASVTTVDGQPATVCRPRTSTCPAILQHALEVTGCETPITDDNACGAADFNDGRCRLNSSMEPRCSYPCLGNEDCQSGSTCPPAGDRYCSL